MMKKKIILLGLILLIITLLFPGAIQGANNQGPSDKVFVLKLNYDEGNLKFINLSIKPGFAPSRVIQPETGYRCEIISSSDEVVYSFKFTIPNKLSAPPPRPGEKPIGSLTLDKINFSLIIPYFKDAKLINIYTPKNILAFSLDISELTKAPESVSKQKLPPAPGARINIVYIAILLAVLAITLYLGFARIRKT